jgi:molybdopterin/thiamine biosynthesis adenylyltransferase/molybdopterin synthase catalytic subunit/rhodanese-related sulfurtransferase
MHANPHAKLLSFSIAPDVIEPEGLKKQLQNVSHGALATFEGWVRNHHEGRPVTALSYGAYPALCETEGQRILNEACDRFQVNQIVCQHRTGDLTLGECAVWVGVSSPHRAEAFAACRWVIDEIKHRLPIWKKETFEDGTTEWVNCQRCAEAAVTSDYPNGFYQKQVMLSEIGQAGQKTLSQSRVLVVGAGGLGVAVLPYLAGAGVGWIRIVEPDQLELSNLHRQVLYRHEDIGQPKAQLAKRHLNQLNPHIEVEIIEERLTAHNVLEHAEGMDLILDCTDNFEAKYLINDAALLLKKPALFASVYQWEGQLYQVTPEHHGGCLRCIWPEEPQQNCLGSCAETGILGVVPGMLGMAQAHGALMHLLKMANPLSDHLVLFQLNGFQQQSIRRLQHSDCPACGRHGNPQALIQDRLEQARLAQEKPLDREWSEFGINAFCITEAQALQTLQLKHPSLRLIDLREPDERWNLTQAPNVPTSVLLSQNNPEQWAQHLPPDQPIMLFCQKGARSQYWLETLRTAGWANLYAWTTDSESLANALASPAAASLSRS